jgi:photosystem II stability/assembly factor-like uncharacterized protein
VTSYFKQFPPHPATSKARGPYNVRGDAKNEKKMRPSLNRTLALAWWLAGIAARRNAFWASLLALVVPLPARAGRGYWTTSGPPFVCVAAFAPDPSEPGRIWAATEYSGVYRTDNGGASWSYAGPAPGAADPSGLVLQFQAITVDPRDPSTVFAAGRYAIYETSDAGSSWRRLDLSSVSSELGRYGGAVSVAVTGSGTVYAAPLIFDPAGGLEVSLIRSRDAGATWERVESGLENSEIDFLAAMPGSDRVLLAGGFDRIFRTEDGGDSWTKVLEVESGYRNSSFLAFDPANSNHVLAAVGPGALYRSTDAGKIWQKAPRAPVVSVLAFDPTDPSTVYAAGQPGDPENLFNVFRSTDAGETWTQLPSPLHFLPQPHGAAARALLVLPASGTVLDSVPNEGVYASSDGGQTWTSRSLGLPGQSPLVAAAGGGLLSISSARSIYFSGNHGRSWTLLANCSPYPLLPPSACTKSTNAFAVAPTAPPTLFYSGSDIHNGFTSRSTDFGASWTYVRLPGGIDPVFTDIVPDGRSPETGFAVDGRLFRTKDGGQTWEQLAPDLFPGLPNGVLRVFVLGDDTVLAPRVDGPIFASSDRGETWTELSPLRDDLGQSWFLVGASGTRQHVLVALVFESSGSPNPQYELRETADAGASWSHLDTPGPPRSLAGDPEHPGRVYLGTQDGGIYVSTDWGHRWNNLAPGLPESPAAAVFQLLLEPGGRFLHAATSNGIYDLSLPFVSPAPPLVPVPIGGRIPAKP